MPALRRTLDVLYAASGVLAALFLVGIFLVVLTQVVLNIVDWAIALVTGSPVGLLLPSYAEFAGYFLAATTFLALASTLRAGVHIRVTLLLQRVPERRRRWVELWCCTFAAAISAGLTWYAVQLTYESWHFGDRSYGIISIPTFIPQIAFALGAAVLTVALVDESIRVARGAVPVYRVSDGEADPARGA